MFKFSFIVLELLLCHVWYRDACKCLHGLGICVWFYPNKLMMMMMRPAVRAGPEIYAARPGSARFAAPVGLTVTIFFQNEQLFHYYPLADETITN